MAESAVAARTALDNIKPGIRRQAGYLAPPAEARIKLNQNENPYPLPPAIKQRILDRAAEVAWRRYPDSPATALRAALAAHTGRRADEIIAGNGSNELLQALVLATVRAGDRVVSVAPTFTLYGLLAGVVEADYHVVPLDEGLAFPVDDLVAAQASAPRLTIVASPNNPTGSRLEIADVARIAAASAGLVALDEAYVEFSRTPRGALDLVDEHDNLVLFRTFSKAWSGAGLRIGYLITNAGLRQEIDKVRLPYNVGVFTRCAAQELLQHGEVLGEQVRAIVRVRDAALERMRGIGAVRVYETDANFILFDCLAQPAAAVFAALLARGILVRDVSGYPKLDRSLRVSVGTPAEMDEFVAALAAVAG